jgi:uncharacterized protein (DUF4415 family)
MADDGEWDARKAAANLKKHGVDFADAATVLHDEQAITVRDDDGDERAVRGQAMKAQYDFTSGKRGPVLKTPAGKTRITIRIDGDLLQWFRKQVHGAGGGSYQTLINAALREYVNTKREPLEATLRRVLREELPRDLKRAAGR